MAVTLLVFSYLIWGLFPIFWKQLAHISPLEILFHRILWSFIFYGGTLIVISLFSKHNRNPFFGGTYNKNLWLKLTASSVMITGNWFLYIYAVNSGQILQGSLAYYISPLNAVCVGAFFFKETLSRQIRWALGFCGLGVLILGAGNSILHGEIPIFPWLALSLAATFSCYGLIKKTVTVPALVSSVLEGTIFVIPSVYFIFYSPYSTIDYYTQKDWIYFVLGGIVTGLPLVFFSFAAQRLPMSTIGFFQYLSPTLQLLTAIFIYHEDFNPIKMTAFLFIWLGVGIYLLTIVKQRPTRLHPRS